MVVGETCCDKLTESTIGTESHATFINYVDRRKAFIASPKWFTAKSGIRSIERSGITILIVPIDQGKFRIHLNDVKGKANHPTLLDAKISAFDYVESGGAATYLAQRQRKIAEQRKALIRLRPTVRS